MTIAEHATTWGPLGEEVYRRTYQRPEDANWEATVQRVVDGNLALAPHAVAPGERERLIELMTSFKLIPAGRHLWASGAKSGLGLFNCHRAGWGPKLSSHFVFTFDQLMLGGGVGANYSTPYLEHLPPVTNAVQLGCSIAAGHPDYAECEPFLHDTDDFFGLQTYLSVEDSREGWVEALAAVIELHTNGVPVALQVDVSKVRPRGSAIKGFGGTASGPGPLLLMLAQVNNILNAAKTDRSSWNSGTLTPMQAMEIDHAIASCVVAGNVRRSARMSILHWNDPCIFDFIDCKADGESHWSTNISVEVDGHFFHALADGDERAVAVLHAVAYGMLRNGEPGVYNSELASVGEFGDVRSTNPCGEIALEEWEQCCLGHVNLAAFSDDYEGAKEAFELMARFLVRATTAPSSSPRQEAIKAANRRIGVGFFGFQEWAVSKLMKWSDTAHDEDVHQYLRSMADWVDIAAATHADELGIPRPIKTRTIAPTGTIATLPGVTAGIHPIFSRYFLRRVRYSSDDPRLEALAAEGHPIEDDVRTANTKVVSYYVEDALVDHCGPELVEQVDELTLDQMFAVQAMVQHYWADNAVSFTANVDPQRWSVEELMDALERWLPKLKGTTIFPEKSIVQAPFERISAAEYHLALAPHEIGQAIDDCAGGACPVR